MPITWIHTPSPHSYSDGIMSLGSPLASEAVGVSARAQCIVSVTSAPCRSEVWAAPPPARPAPMAISRARTPAAHR